MKEKPSHFINYHIACTLNKQLGFTVIESVLCELRNQILTWGRAEMTDSSSICRSKQTTTKQYIKGKI